ncbi:hypothetical protein SAMD00019534_040370 [Acytostelium subglobosum LB1]|uniref:hypothetical protein n=1 Tax=Acytostelium subglobosum LB1 TaxID=1410327 RepID=UPI000645238A|nr:hypothetical protein SAMD00019534_040370 [Acytostelium subglobosum LB1]GAM20862.1 hypothetical protein SAMD00019534_040370 [Acytostelium subglobosum LB1]|eukprot:XP_012755996.1 hypothetical protein SAMD00019534_040370 [Acytostelium subglobosum LB1]
MRIGTLYISVLEGRGLSPKDSNGASDPYCVVIAGDKKKKTKAIKHTLNPKWESENFEMPIEHLCQFVYVEVYDWDRFSSDDPMGMATIPIAMIYDSTTSETMQWFPLEPMKNVTKVAGELKLKFRYERSSEAKQKNPLIKAIKENDLNTLDSILKLQTDINVCDTEGTPALHLAAASNNIPLMMLLLKHNDSKILQKDSLGNSPLHLFSQKCLTLTSEEPILKLIDKGCSTNAQNNFGETPLHTAIMSTTPKTFLIEVLLNKGANINQKTKNDETPLLYAIKFAKVEFVRLLIQRGADINMEGGSPPKKPMDLARQLNNSSIVQRLQMSVEISEWLANLQLGSLTPIFIGNEIFFDVLPDVDEATLDRLQVTDKDQRSKLQAAIRKLRVPPLTNSSSSLANSTGSGRTVETSTSKTTAYSSNNSNSPFKASNGDAESTTKNIDTNGQSSNSGNSESSTTNNSSNNNGLVDDDLDIPDAKGAHIKIDVDELARLKHTHLDDASWVIDESNLKFQTLLGVGASGKVYKGLYKGGTVAIKVLKSFTNEKDVLEFKKEFQIVSSLKSPSVVHFHGAVIKDKLCIVMELCSRGSLFHILQDKTIRFTWTEFFNLALQAISSLNSLHTWSPQILHRDLKSLNLLVTEDWVVKICDFGLSRFDTGSNLETLGKLRGTYAYVAPEVYFGNKYTVKSDVYSMGMIVWEMIYRCINGEHQFPFQEYPQLKFDFQILIASAKKDLRPTFPAATPKCLIDIVSQALLKDFALRPTAEHLYDEVVKCRNEYMANAAEWDALCTIPVVPPPTTPVAAATTTTTTTPTSPPPAQPPSPQQDQQQQVEPKKPSALPDHLSRTRSVSSPVEPAVLKK